MKEKVGHEQEGVEEEEEEGKEESKEGGGGCSVSLSFCGKGDMRIDCFEIEGMEELWGGGCGRRIGFVDKLFTVKGGKDKDMP